jgi:hypothetical protein
LAGLSRLFTVFPTVVSTPCTTGARTSTRPLTVVVAAWPTAGRRAGRTGRGAAGPVEDLGGEAVGGGGDWPVFGGERGEVGPGVVAETPPVLAVAPGLDAARAGEPATTGRPAAVAATGVPTSGARARSAGGTLRGPEVADPRTAPLPSGKARGALAAEPLTVNPLIDSPNQKMATSIAIKAKTR